MTTVILDWGGTTGGRWCHVASRGDTAGST